MFAIIRYTLLTATRDWLFIGLGVLLLMAFGLAFFMGSTALSEQMQMTLAYFAGSARAILAVGLTLFVCFHVKRAFDNREIEAMMTKPLSRTQFVVGYWMAMALLAALSVVPAVLIIGVLLQADMVGLLVWSVSLAMELTVLVAFALLAALIMRSAVAAAMASLAFYLVSRLMGFFVMALQTPGSLMGKSSNLLLASMESLLLAISTIIPRFDLYAKSSWLIYGVDSTGGAASIENAEMASQVWPSELWIFPTQTIIFIMLLLAVAVFDLKRKEF